MSLEKEIDKARKEIVSDGYDMSLGEVINLYRDEEFIINPEFQRLFRWDITRKTRFIESILLGIPIPPIFVFQDIDGNWELIDGLQRMSTILEFCGVLKGADGKRLKPSTLEGTSFLPSLADRTWQAWDSKCKTIDKSMQLQIKRARIRVEILLKESDEQAKYELFQRLNTGGARLSEQEVRNCVAVMINRDCYQKIKELSEETDFKKTTSQTKKSIKKQVNMELTLRFLAFRNVTYKNGLDVHEYLDLALINIAENPAFNWKSETLVFKKTFSLLNEALGSKAFKRWDNRNFKGMFLMSVYEVMAFGVSQNIKLIEKMGRNEQCEFIVRKAKSLWDDECFNKNSGAGVRGTTRLANLLPMAKGFFKP